VEPRHVKTELEVSRTPPNFNLFNKSLVEILYLTHPL